MKNNYLNYISPKHEEGGILKAAWGDSVVRSTAKDRERLKKLFTKESDLDEIKNPFEQEKQESQSSSKQETVTWDNLNNEYDASVSQPSVITQQVNPTVASNFEFTVDKSKPRGYRNNNPLNIRISDNAWSGKIANNTDGSFEQFEDMAHGYRAGFLNMKTHINGGNNTIRKLINVWAPASDGNDPESYANKVASAAGISADEIINPKDPNIMQKIVLAMAKVENKQDANPDDVVQGWKLYMGSTL